jgi:hypothetical protein
MYNIGNLSTSREPLFQEALSKNDHSLEPPEGEKRFQYYLSIATAVNWLLNFSVPELGLKEIRERYLSILQRQDLATHIGRIRQQELLAQFTLFYSPDFLQKVNSVVNYSQDNWLSKMVRQPRTVTHPLRHILLMNFLGATPESFFTGAKPLSFPFGTGPWPCLNPASPHYRWKVIKTVSVHPDSKAHNPV